MAKSMRQKVTKYISGQYGVDPEFPWDGDDTSAVFRAVRGPRSVPNSLRYALDEEPDA
jgi:hypothetical protein